MYQKQISLGGFIKTKLKVFFGEAVPIVQVQTERPKSNKPSIKPFPILTELYGYALEEIFDIPLAEQEILIKNTGLPIRLRNKYGDLAVKDILRYEYQMILSQRNIGQGSVQDILKYLRDRSLDNDPALSLKDYLLRKIIIPVDPTQIFKERYQLSEELLVQQIVAIPELNDKIKKCLSADGIITLADLMERTLLQIERLRGLGSISINIIIKYLENNNLKDKHE